MDLIRTAWRGRADVPDRMDDNHEVLWPGAPVLPNHPAQLIPGTYVPGNVYQSGGTMQVAANYGTEGSLSINEWTPTYVPRVGATTPANGGQPQWNHLVPIRWDLQVMTDNDLAVRGQQALTQVPSQAAAQFTPPGTASITFD